MFDQKKKNKFFNTESAMNYYKQTNLLQIATAFFITKCDTVYYKLRQVLQSAMIITNCDRCIAWALDR